MESLQNKQRVHPLPSPRRYPKPGRTNPFVNVYSASVARAASSRRQSPAPILLEPPKYFDDREKIIYAVAWATDNEVSLTWENRHQGRSNSIVRMSPQGHHREVTSPPGGGVKS